MGNCEYCVPFADDDPCGDYISTKEDDGMAIRVDGLNGCLVMHGEKDFACISINYCPMCGRDLEEEL